jgi:hypothetical protein
VCLLCQVEVSASGHHSVQRSPTERCMSECGRENSTARRPWPTRGCRAMKEKNYTTYDFLYYWPEDDRISSKHYV